jgi:hypothetical protein
MQSTDHPDSDTKQWAPPSSCIAITTFSVGLILFVGFVAVAVIGQIRLYQQTCPLAPRFNVILYPLDSPDPLVLSSHARQGMIDTSRVAKVIRRPVPGLYYKELRWADGTSLWNLHVHLIYPIVLSGIAMLVSGICLIRKHGNS